ncbi:eukaryotic peptide chain release factor GTP-binding subunit ERF3A-like [Corticium candelabrum]|uniref:eukaryotic peptide chain release factor GTP-binding subunit ERF3A-like n=1 Tax=Corticium candelabrum TaxID=121492 RepID=UPI002E32F6F3|nr:eukaryotic peptide chain release factor GTP-binding subunit ERF3A-like [Corticium candelabrum]
MGEPDSWESLVDPNDVAKTNSTLNPDATSFSLNVHAQEFVPSFLRKSDAPAQPPGQRAIQTSSDEVASDKQMVPTGGKSAVASDTRLSHPAGGDVVNDKETSTACDQRLQQEASTDISHQEEIKVDAVEEGIEKLQVGSREKETKPAKSASVTAAMTAAAAAAAAVAQPEKENINIIFIGHVDAGKSTIGGHLMYLTGQVDKRTLEKYEREAKEKNRETWYLSWALDTNQEERDKGKTVEVGRASFDTENKHFSILDAPGHRSFVPNMIGGAQQADIGILVISARKGEFETGFERGGQTREHAMLAKTAGVRHLVVLINKMDDPTVEWSEERYEECKTKLTPFLKKVGFNPKTDIYYMPVSGLTGANLKDPLPASLCPWYRGPSFISYLDELPSLTRRTDLPLRMPIVDKYKDMGTVVLGRVESGVIQKGSTLMLMPNKTSVEVLAVLFDDLDVPQASCGKTLKVKLKGVEEEDISAGFVLCPSLSPCHAATKFRAQVVILEHKSIICAGYSAVLHIHACVEEVQFVSLLALLDKKGQKSKQQPRFVKQDQVCIADLEAAGIICIEEFSEFPSMGRFTLRDEGRTIAVGKVLKLVE